jgi:serine phosphatase RsbU (regulator of sigma subunit)/HAMP domain-containing protein
MFKNFGVRGRLLLSFIGISAFAVFTTVAAIYSFGIVQFLFDKVTDQRVPTALAVQELSSRVERNLAETPTLLSASTEKERLQSWEKISTEFEAIDELLLLLRSQGFAIDPLNSLQNNLGLLRSNLLTLYTLVGERISLTKHKESLLGSMDKEQEETLDVLGPWRTSVNNNVQRLRSTIKNDRLSSEDRSIAERELIESLALLSSLQQTYQSITEIHHILIRITDAEKYEDIELLKFRAQWSLEALATLSKVVGSQLRLLILAESERFSLFMKGEDNMPSLRAHEITLINNGEKVKRQNIYLSQELTELVELIVRNTQLDISQATIQAHAVQKKSSIILILIASMSLVCSLLIVWLYVGRNLIARLTALSNSMRAIAGGDLRASLPVPGSNDEIGGMTEALVVFRDTAIEVEENNLRDIEAARRRLIDAIENSSEGFVFFDREDRLVICNTRYHELLHQNTDITFEPGTKFETIIRKAALSGHILDAEGRIDEWVADRLALHHDPGEPQIQQRSGGQWILITERKTGDGGTVAIYSDISNLKQREEELEDALEERERAFSLLDEELSEAAEYVKNILPHPIQKGEIIIDWKFIPSTSLGGDAFGYYWLDENHFVIYLIDVSGHGVGAALLSVSVINALRSQSLTGTDFKDPAQVLASLNEAFPCEENNYMFFTIWYGVYNKSTRELTYASGGHPPALIIEDTPEGDSRILSLKTANAAIGAIPDINYMKNKHLVSENAALYIFSDGVYEVERSDGSMWQLSEFVDFMRRAKPTDSAQLDNLYNYVQSITIQKNFEDDFTLLAATFK